MASDFGVSEEAADSRSCKRGCQPEEAAIGVVSLANEDFIAHWCSVTGVCPAETPPDSESTVDGKRCGGFKIRKCNQHSESK